MRSVKKEHATFIANALRYCPHVLSDEDLKDIGHGLDKEDILKAISDNDGPYTENELRMIVKAVGDMDDKHHFDKYGDAWNDDTLDKYADHIYNYLYKYKEEATKVDPEIDPEQEHIGPMAQDIEKVNPACVVETPEGVKTVDTGRLALMNAGAIAEIARELKGLKNGNTSCI